MRSSWLCPTTQDRERVLENSRRVGRARQVASLSVAFTLIYFTQAIGWWGVVLIAASAVNLQTVDWRIRRSRKPEYHVAFSILWSQIITGAAIALTGGAASPAIGLLAIPVVFAAARFPPRVVFASTGTAITILLISTAAIHPAATLANPGGLIIGIAMIVGIAGVGHALNGAERQMRDTAIVDPLTGLLNRTGLERRLAELAEQARVGNEPISLLMCDLDRFKEVNDFHGHTVGDDVLRELGTELRRHMRAFDLAYRLGGEEFLVVLPGATLPEARALAERLCAATRICRPRGLALTMSVGVSTSYGGREPYAELLEAADRAMYRAKAEGRDRVCSAPPRAAGELGEPANGAGRPTGEPRRALRGAGEPGAPQLATHPAPGLADEPAARASGR